MRHLSAIIQIAALAVLDPRQDLAFGGGVALELVCDDHPRNIPQALQQLAEEPRGRGRIAPALNQNVEGRCQVANRQMLMAENSFSGGYAADAVPATSRHVRNAVSRAARCSLALR